MKFGELEELFGEFDEFFSRGEFEKALQPIEEILEEDETVGLAWKAKGMCLYELKDFEESLACLEKAHALLRGDYQANCVYWKGLTLLSLGKASEAVELFESIPEDVYALFALFLAHLSTENKEKARDKLTKAFALDEGKTTHFLQACYDEFILPSKTSSEDKFELQEKINELRKEFE